ncbi:MAG: hypothetical protein IK122_03700 [Alphaproteobacteria bacterium]|nr:hypothetical protein [Alphaproteobacteria bacterium]
MKKKFVLPSLFVLNAFLVGLTPKTSKAGQFTTTYNPKTDSMSYALNYQLPPSCTAEFAKAFVQSFDSVEQQNEMKDSVSYSISWLGRLWVKYTSKDGSGFIRTGGSRTWRNMNPGALRYGDFSKQNGACGVAGGFAVFPTEECGMEALRNLLQSDKYASLTIAAAIYKYAPPSDHNNTRAYQKRLSRMTGLSLNKKLNQLTPEELDNVALAIKELEGWKSGENEFFDARNDEANLVSDYNEFLKHRIVNQKQYSA